jgi:topoisomerase-4 subunit A
LGEPLSSRLDPPDGAKWRGVMIGEPEDLWLVATDAGYGFTVRLKEVYTRNRAGKVLLSVPEGALVLPPASVPGDDALVAVTSKDGKLLVFKVKDVPELARGKGNKLFDVPAKKFAKREDYLTGMTVVAKDKSLIVRSGDRKMTLAWGDLKDYRGERAQRGSVLPRGWRTVDMLETE